MTGTSVAGLPPKALQAALRHTTERLCSELASPGSVPPDWSAPEWIVARAAARIHGIAPLLASRLRWQGPEGWASFVEEESVDTQTRHLQVMELLRRLHERLRRAGVAAVPLKGAALYAAALYGPGERPMADVDLLVRSCDLETASATLQELGFQESLRLWKNRLFRVSEPGDHAQTQEACEDRVKVELHERICEMLPVRLVDISASIFPRDAAPGVNPYPSRAALIAHLLLHAAGSIVDRALRFIQLLDIAVLSDRATSEDWRAVFCIGQEQQPPWWALPPLALTARYFPGRIPQQVLDTARSCCPPALRRISKRQRISEVSLSYPWIGAFPAIGWIRSPGEALGYIAARLVRGKEATSLRKLASSTEPGLSPKERHWLAESQMTRILRWAVARPGRPLSMRAIRKAFGEPT